MVASGAIQKASNGELIEGSYIVMFKNGVSDTDMATHMKTVELDGGVIEHVYNGNIHGYVVSHDVEDVIAKHSEDPVVDWVEQNQIARAFVEDSRACREYPRGTNGLWGLGRVSNAAPSQTTLRIANEQGRVIDIYIIDTGIQTTHADFEDRATHAFDCTGQGPGDGNGHGTHCASTAAGAEYGVAVESDLFAVKVLNSGGSGTFACVIQGIEYVGAQNGDRIGSLSLGGGFSAAVNAAVDGAVGAGAAMASASGNSNANACNFSPASAARGITVNSMQAGDGRSSFSNFGTCTDIFAPGTNVMAAWIGGNTATRTISGTSMACPHVAGVMAETWSDNRSLNGADVQALVIANGETGRITNPGTGSPNVLVQTTCAQ